MRPPDVLVVVLVLATAAVLAGVALMALRRRYDSSLRRLRHFLEGHLHDGRGPELPTEGPAEVRALAQVATEIVVRRPAAQSAEPGAAVVVDLLSHLPGPLVVCAGDGRVALANEAARALVPEGALVPGRSVFAAMDRRDLEPALRMLDEGPDAWLPVAVRVVGTGRAVPLRVATVPPVAGFVLLGEPAPPGHAVPGPRPRFSDLSVLQAPPLPTEWTERSLDEVVMTVLDCETTGLDPNVDAVVSVAAVHVVRGRVADHVLDRLVDPARPIPRTATAVHGLADADVAGQPPLAHVVPELRRFAADSVVVGHDVGFDLAFLSAAGFAASGPVLDTLLLAEVCQPGASRYGLEDVATRLGVAVEARHSALGDAVTTARVLVALLPLLGRAGIRTVGQASRACARSPSAKAMAARPWVKETPG